MQMATVSCNTHGANICILNLVQVPSMSPTMSVQEKVNCIGLYNYSGKMNSNLARRDGPMRNERTVDYLFARAVCECVARILRTVSALYRGKKQIWRAPIHLRGNNDAGVYACIQRKLVIAPRICMFFFYNKD